MTEKKVSTRYANAILSAATAEGLADTVLNDFVYINTKIDESKDFKAFLDSPVIQFWKKKKILDEIFTGKIHKLTLNFLHLITEKHRDQIIIDIMTRYEELYNLQNNILPIGVQSAVELDDNLKNSISSKLADNTGKNVKMNYKVEESLKGGMIIEIDDWVWDASVSNQLEKLYERLAYSQQ